MRIYGGYISFIFEAPLDSADDMQDALSKLESLLVKKAKEIGFSLEGHDSECWEEV